jgi:membrane-bound metal-dependent hydrolase YbcI (DUF457 family)
MASPVFHGLAGVGLAYALAGDASLPLFVSLRKALPVLMAGAVLACLPDVDYLPGVLRGYLNTTHQQATHSVVWVLLVSAGIWLTGRACKPVWFGWHSVVFLLVLIGSHLVIDLVTADGFAPYGIPLGTPFADARVQAPFALLPMWRKTAWADLGHWANVRALAIETGLGVALAAACVAAKRSWTQRKAAL